jgi:hypothetical protein
MQSVEQTISAIAAYAQQWQTLLAAFVALAAAKRAYAAAMAKVEFDRDLAEQALISRKLGLFLRLHHSLLEVMFRTRNVAEYLKGIAKESDETEVEVETESLRIYLPTEIDEAWNSLELFPGDTMKALSTLKRIMPVAMNFEQFFPTLIEGKAKTTRDDLFDYRVMVGDVEASAKEIFQSLDSAIDEFRTRKTFA